MIEALTTKVQALFEETLPDDLIEKLADATGFRQRDRKIEVVKFIRAAIIAAGTGFGGRQADILRLYVDNGGTSVVRGAFYSRFGKPLESTMQKLSERLLERVRQQPKDLPGILGAHVTDWHIVDSSTVQLEKDLVGEYPSTGTGAALKVHKRFSVGIGTTWGYHLSPAREHDSRHLKIDESWRGLGLLVDLGYASTALIRDCFDHDVHFVMRLKENWKPKVKSISRGDVAKEFFPGTDLDVLIDKNIIVLNGKCVNANVTIGRGTRAVDCRLVGVPVVDGAGYRFYLTSLPSSVGPLQVCDLYRVRWEIECDNKLDKSCSKLSDIGAKTGPAVRALVHASLISSILACTIVHEARLLETPPPRAGTERMAAPLHPQTLARAMGGAAMSIAGALEKRGKEAESDWKRITTALCHLGRDPNWRQRPSILDQLRGWKISPGRTRSARPASTQAGL